MFCSACGKELAAGGQFCQYCGQAVNGAARQPSTPGGAAQGVVIVRNPHRGKMEMMVGTVVLIIGMVWLVGSCVASIYSNTGTWGWQGGASVLVSILGVVIHLIGRFRHWYHWE